MISERKTIGANDVMRFILELWALVAYGYLGLDQNLGLLNYILMVIFPLVIAILWGIFAVPNDPSRSGGAPIPVPGAIRLVLEFLIFGGAFWIMFAGILIYVSLVYIILVIIHYILARERIRWLLSN
jgi:hypothetical protein